MAVRIGKRVIDGLETTGREYFLWDDDLPGFGVRVRATGVKSYVFQYRAGAGRSAPSRRFTLGGIGKLTPEQARKLARDISGDVAHGKDPAHDKADDRKALTVAQKWHTDITGPHGVIRSVPALRIIIVGLIAHLWLSPSSKCEPQYSGTRCVLQSNGPSKPLPLMLAWKYRPMDSADKRLSTVPCSISQ